MTDLDTLARAATTELVDSSHTDLRLGLADLRRTRTRRTTAKVAAAGAVAALAVGGWQLIGPREDAVEPAPRPGAVQNGTLLGLPGEAVGPRARWVTVSGEPITHLPDDGALFSQYQFTQDGTEIVYADRRARISAVDVTTGVTRTLADCPDDICAAAVSPDLGTVASSNSEGVWLTTVGSDEKRPVSAMSAAGAPAWAPDGRSLAFASTDGVYVLDLDSGDVRRVSPSASEVTGPVDWSPDGRSLAYLTMRPVADHDYAFTATVVDLSTGVSRSLLDAGHCGCGGLPQPTLTWSPDGQGVAVATTRGADLPWGVYLVPLDGRAPQKLSLGSFAALAWQPLKG